MKWSEFFSSAITGAREAGIEIEPDTPAQKEEIAVAVAPTVQPADTTAIEAEQAQLKTALTEAQAKIAAMETAVRDARFTALASTFYGATADHLAVLTALGEDTPGYTAYVTQQRAATEALRQAKLFTHAGSEQSGGGGAWNTIEGKARALMAEQPGLTIEQATVQVMDADPSLYRQYVSESR